MVLKRWAHLLDDGAHGGDLHVLGRSVIALDALEQLPQQALHILRRQQAPLLRIHDPLQVTRVVEGTGRCVVQLGFHGRMLDTRVQPLHRDLHIRLSFLLPRLQIPQRVIPHHPQAAPVSSRCPHEADPQLPSPMHPHGLAGLEQPGPTGLAWAGAVCQ